VSYFLSSLPLWLLIALIVAVPTILAMGAQALIHRRVGVTKLAKNNEIAGFKFATVGVIYRAPRTYGHRRVGEIQ